MFNINIYKRLGNDKKGIEIRFKASVKTKAITAVFGKSGIGKTTVLRLLAGLDQPDAGKIEFNECVWFEQGEKIKLKDRPIGMVFQDFNLFENMTVLQNLKYAANDNIPKEILNLAGELQVKKLYNRYPDELSKGQQQKVSIIRSLCQPAELLLLDEPFSALDDDSIVEIIDVIQQLKSTLGVTIILVTHRKDVILKMADEVVMMEIGKQGHPKDLLKTSF